MFNRLKKDLYVMKKDALLAQGFQNGQIGDFSELFYNVLEHTYLNGLPVSIYVKYLNKKQISEILALDKATCMFLCFENATLVYACSNYRNSVYRSNNNAHNWIEIGEYVYDPDTLCRYDKELYYEIYEPYDIKKFSLEEFCKDNKQSIDEIVTTHKEDYKSGGKYVHLLPKYVEAVKEIAVESKIGSFIGELDKYLIDIGYSYDYTYDEIEQDLVRKNHQ